MEHSLMHPSLARLARQEWHERQEPLVSGLVSAQ
jgi:hypothetical protein